MEKRIFDEKTLRKLAGFLPHKRGGISRFTPDFLNIGEGSPAFLTSELGDDEFDAQRGKNIETTAQARAWLKEIFGKSGLMGWDNLPDIRGADVPASAEAIDDFGAILVWTLFNHIRNA